MSQSPNKTDLPFEFSESDLESLSKSQLIDLINQYAVESLLVGAEAENFGIALALLYAKKPEFQHHFELSRQEASQFKKRLKSHTGKPGRQTSESFIGLLGSLINEPEAWDFGLFGTGSAAVDESFEQVRIDEEKLRASQRRQMSKTSGSRSKSKKGKGRSKGAQNRLTCFCANDKFRVVQRKAEVNLQQLEKMNPAHMEHLAPRTVTRLIYDEQGWTWLEEEQERIACYPAEETSGSQPEPVIVLSEDAQPELLPGSPVNVTAIAIMIGGKYLMDLPTARIARELSENGFLISGQTISSWLIQTALIYLSPLVERMKEHLQQQEIVHMDETCFTRLNLSDEMEPDQGWFVQARSAKAMADQIVLYEYFPSLNSSFVETMLGDLSERKVAVHCSGSEYYQGFGENVRVISCQYHAQNKITAGVKALPALSRYRNLKESENLDKICRANQLRSENRPLDIGLSLLEEFSHLAMLEKKLEEKPWAEIFSIRHQEAKPRLDRIYELVQQGLAEPSLDTAPVLKEGLNYLADHKKTLYEYLEDGRYEISSYTQGDLPERVSCLRKGRVLVESEYGGKITAIYLSILSTCQKNQIDPQLYLIYVLDQLQKKHLEGEELDDLLPYSSQMPDWVKKK